MRSQGEQTSWSQIITTGPSVKWFNQFFFLLSTSGSPCSSIILTHLHFRKGQIDPWNFGFMIVGRVDSFSQFYQSPSYELRHACQLIVNFDENHQRNWMKRLLILFQVWNIKNQTYRFLYFWYSKLEIYRRSYN